jgi:hypothetical protein
MDIKCATCGEPWDTHHLFHDEVSETAAGLEMIHDELDLEDWAKKMCSFSSFSERELLELCPKPTPRYVGEPWECKLTPFWREQFKERGWEFGASLMAVLKCSCCEEGKERSGAARIREDYKVISELLEGDDDGIAVELAEY